MGMIQFNYRSEALGYYVNISIAYPTDGLSYMSDEEAAKQKVNPHVRRESVPLKPGMKFQTLYLIHGGGDENTLPFRYTNIERYAQQNRVMVVAPGVPNSFGADALYGVKYMTFLTEELPVVVQSLFASSPKREDNFVMGFAMGGNVALAMAIMHPEKYQTCVDMSGGIGFTLATDTMVSELAGDHFSTFFPRFNATFGPAEQFAGSPNDLYPIAKAKKEAGEELTDFIILCGSEEFIRARVEDDVRILKELGYPVRYVCPEGYDHNYDTWDSYMRIALDEWLPLRRAPIYE